ncbi:hypothetical protein [Flavobacterium oreochromis]|uniref:Carboxypeptidase-like regulatory domain-containing protein n=1 Tax=Flavobacterium columnare TaxID=996 RepID=A0A246GAS1_9FLAO|nr:hypothetical protein [Flavobacterium oreochromis]OWP77210.1 hypothetical protein BWK62_08100 [Flavobacterium oreochromis]
MKSKIVLWVLFAISQFGFAQNKILLDGIVQSDLGPLDQIIVINRTTKETTTTSSEGKFKIQANSDNLLVFTSSKIEPLEIRLNSNSFKQNPFVVKVKVKVVEMEEVVVKTISAKKLGIITENVKSYTPAERKLLEAGSFKWYSFLLIPVGGMSMTGLINQISGRTAMLKKELKVEQSEINKNRLKSVFSQEFYRDILKIPDNYLDGFIVYASENSKIAQDLQAKNFEALRFDLIDLAVRYKEIITIQK